MTDIATLRQRLEDAEAARHRLLTGAQRERINRGGTEITYTRAEISALDRYIAELRNDIARANGDRPYRSAVNLFF